jgi:hypothetical protein
MHYFESHPIRVVTSFGLEEIISNRLATTKITKWALELMGLDITYVPQTVVKSQTLADFLAEWFETQQPPPPDTQEHWTMYFDGSFTLNGVEGSIVLISPKGDRLIYIIQMHFCATNNMVEYEALVNGLHITAELRI